MARETILSKNQQRRRYLNNVWTMTKIQKLYQALKIRHGHPGEQWRLWCKRPKTTTEREEVVIGAILTQRANWRNVELAINNLKKAGFLSLNKISRLKDRDKNKMTALIRSSGFYKQKAGYLLGLAKFVIKSYGGLKKMSSQPLSILRQELLVLKGIGPETADSILLYALEKPVFVIDEYTRRLAKKKRLSRDLSYAHLQTLFEKNLKKDYRLYQDFHALVVIEGKY